MNAWLLTAWLKENRERLLGADVGGVRSFDPRGVAIELDTEAGERLWLCISSWDQEQFVALWEPDKLPEEAELKPADESWLPGICEEELPGSELEELNHEHFERIFSLEFAKYGQYGERTARRLVCELIGRLANQFLLSGRERIMAMMKKLKLSGDENRRELRSGAQYEPPEPLDRVSPLEIEHYHLKPEQPGGRSALRDELINTVHGCGPEVADALLTDADPAGDELPNTETLAERTRKLAEAVVEGDAERLSAAFGADSVQEAIWRRYREPLHDYLEKQREQAERAVGDGEPGPKLRMGIHEFHSLDEVKQQLTEWRELKSEVRSWVGRDAGDKQWNEQVEDWAEDSSLDRLFDPDRGPGKLVEKLEGLIQAVGARARDTDWDSAPEPAEKTGGASEAESKTGAEQERDKYTRLRDNLKEKGINARVFPSTDGYPLVCGKGSQSNQDIYQHYRGGNHYWFHSRNYPGSHVILVCGGREPSPEAMHQAAVVAANFSKGSGKQEIRYTRMKNLYRTKGLPPGKVLLREERVMTVDGGEFEDLEREWRRESRG